MHTCVAPVTPSLNWVSSKLRSGGGPRPPMQPDLNIPTCGRVFFHPLHITYRQMHSPSLLLLCRRRKAPILCHWHETVCPVLLFICGLFCDYTCVTWRWINKRRQKRRVLKLIPAQTRGRGGERMSLEDNSWLTFLPFCNLKRLKDDFCRHAQTTRTRQRCLDLREDSAFPAHFFIKSAILVAAFLTKLRERSTEQPRSSHLPVKLVFLACSFFQKNTSRQLQVRIFAACSEFNLRGNFLCWKSICAVSIRRWKKTARRPIRIVITGTADRSFLYVLSFSLRMEAVGKDQTKQKERMKLAPLFVVFVVEPSPLKE